MISLVNTGPNVPQDISLGFHNTEVKDGWPAGCMLDLIVRPIPEEVATKYNLLTGKVEQAELHHVHFESLVNEYIDDAQSHTNLMTIDDMEAWAKEFEQSASKIRLAISRMLIENIAPQIKP